MRWGADGCGTGISPKVSERVWMGERLVDRGVMWCSSL